jgi:hypothetical protein
MTAEPLYLTHCDHGLVGWREGCRCQPCKDAAQYRGGGLRAHLTDCRPRQQPARGWHEQAACLNQDTGRWFEDGPAMEARMVCWACPVDADCLAAAMVEEAGRSRWGVRGGLLPDQRRRLEKAWQRANYRGHVNPAMGLGGPRRALEALPATEPDRLEVLP